MAITLNYPTNRQLRQIAAIKAPNLEAQRKIFEILPIDTVDSHVVEWMQEDNYAGLMQVRGLGGRPNRVMHVGGKHYIMQPGVYGEFMIVDETEITKRRQWGQLSDAPVDVSDLVMQRQSRLLARRYDRIEYIGWTLLIAGTFSVSNPNGTVLHTDAYTTQTFTSSVAWSTPATSTPLADFRAIQLLGRGKGVSFGAQSKAYLSRVTLNRMLSNTNNADIAGRRTSGLNTVLTQNEANSLLLGEGLPQIELYDEGYLSEPSGTFTLWIPDGKIVVVGKRTDGSAIGNFLMTRNANNPNSAPGAYQKIVDKGVDSVPREIEVHDGFNGGAALYFPSAVVVMNV